MAGMKTYTAHEREIQCGPCRVSIRGYKPGGNNSSIYPKKGDPLPRIKLGISFPHDEDRFLDIEFGASNHVLRRRLATNGALVRPPQLRELQAMIQGFIDTLIAEHGLAEPWPR